MTKTGSLDLDMFEKIFNLISLTKPRINALVLVTTFVGMSLAQNGIPPFNLFTATLIGTGLTVASASVFNCYQEIETDAQMTRTEDRPLPAGNISPRTALKFGTILGLLGLTVLYLVVNSTSTLLAVVALITYTPIYTMLKPVTSLSTIIGAIPGALPPVIGWSAVTGSISVEATVLFLIMFFWQPPHFLALAIVRKQEYEQAQLAMLPVEGSTEVALRQIIVYQAALLPVSLMPFRLEMAGEMYFMSALSGGILFLVLGIGGLFISEQNRSSWSKLLFAFSIVYLTALFGFLLIDPAVPQ